MVCGGINDCSSNYNTCLSLYDFHKEGVYFISPIENMQKSDLYIKELNWGLTTFDNFLTSLYVVFQSATFEAWSDIMYMVMNGQDYYISLFYFIFLIFILSYFILNLTVAVMLYNFQKYSDESIKENIVKHKKINKDFNTIVNQTYQLSYMNGYNNEGKVNEINGNINISIKSPTKTKSPTKKNISISKFNSAQMNSKNRVEINDEDNQDKRDMRRNYSTIASDYFKLPSVKKMKFILSKFNKIEFLKKVKPVSEFQKNYKFAFRLYSIYSQPIVQWFIYLIISISCLLLTLERKDRSNIEVQTTEIVNMFCVLIFILEIILNIGSFGPRSFFKSYWNINDFVITILSVIDISSTISSFMTAEGMSIKSKSGNIFGIIKILRILRLFKLVRTWQNFQIIIISLKETLIRMVDYSIVFILFVYIYSLLGNQIFKNSLNFDIYTNQYTSNNRISNNNYYNFDTFLESILSVFQIIIGDNWSQFYFDCLRSSKVDTNIANFYFITLVLFGRITLLNIFLAYLIDNFQSARAFLKKNVKVKDYLSNVIIQMSSENDKEIGIYNKRRKSSIANAYNQYYLKLSEIKLISEGKFVLHSKNELDFYNTDKNKIIKAETVIIAKRLFDFDKIYEEMENKVKNYIFEIDNFYEEDEISQIKEVMAEYEKNNNNNYVLAYNINIKSIEEKIRKMTLPKNLKFSNVRYNKANSNRQSFSISNIDKNSNQVSGIYQNDESGNSNTSIIKKSSVAFKLNNKDNQNKHLTHDHDNKKKSIINRRISFDIKTKLKEIKMNAYNKSRSNISKQLCNINETEFENLSSARKGLKENVFLEDFVEENKNQIYINNHILMNENKKNIYRNRNSLYNITNASNNIVQSKENKENHININIYNDNNSENIVSKIESINHSNQRNILLNSKQTTKNSLKNLFSNESQKEEIGKSSKNLQDYKKGEISKSMNDLNRLNRLEIHIDNQNSIVDEYKPLTNKNNLLHNTNNLDLIRIKISLSKDKTNEINFLNFFSKIKNDNDNEKNHENHENFENKKFTYINEGNKSKNQKNEKSLSNKSSINEDVYNINNDKKEEFKKEILKKQTIVENSNDNQFQTTSNKITKKIKYKETISKMSKVESSNSNINTKEKSNTYNYLNEIGKLKKQKLSFQINQDISKKNKLNYYDYFTSSSLFIFHKDFLVRRMITKISESTYFEYIIAFFIILNCATIILDTPWNDPSSNISLYVKYSNYTFTLIFIFEAVLKIISRGFIFYKNDEVKITNENLDQLLKQYLSNKEYDDYLNSKTSKTLTNDMKTSLISKLNKITTSRKAYLREYSNFFDFIIVVFSSIDFFFEISQLNNMNFAYLKAIRAFKSLRPIRIISKSENLKIIIDCIINSVPALGKVLLAVGTFIFIYSIVGINLFKDSVGHYCSISNNAFYEVKKINERIDFNKNPYEIDYLIDNKTYYVYNNNLNVVTSYDSNNQYIIRSTFYLSSKNDCEAYGGKWVYYYENFDNFLNALKTLFELMISDGWVFTLYYSSIITSKWSYLFYVSYILVGYFFILNLLVSVVIDKFKSLKNKSLFYSSLSEEEQEWFKVQKIMLKYKPSPKIETLYDNASNFIRKMYFLVTNIVFERVMATLIFLSIIPLVLQYKNQSDEYTYILELINTIFIGIFNIELIMKLVVFRRRYFNNGWFTFDFIVIVITDITFIISINFFGLSNETDKSNQSINKAYILIRTVRILRILRLFAVNNSMRSLIDTLVFIIPTIANIGLVLFVVILVYSSIGVQFFYALPYREDINQFNNFRNFGNSALLLFRAMTGEGWNKVMNEATYHYCKDEYMNSIDYNQDYYCISYPNIKCVEDTEITYNGLINLTTMSCGNYFSYVYFISFQILAPIIIMNLFVVIVIEGFSDSMYENESMLCQENMEEFISIWMNYDPKCKRTILPQEFLLIMKELKPPIGIGYDRHYIEEPYEKIRNMKRYRNILDCISKEEKEIRIVETNQKIINKKSEKSNKNIYQRLKIEEERNFYNNNGFYISKNMRTFTTDLEILKTIKKFNFTALYEKDSLNNEISNENKSNEGVLLNNIQLNYPFLNLFNKKSTKIGNNNITNKPSHDSKLIIHYIEACLGISKFLVAQKHKIDIDKIRENKVGLFIIDQWKGKKEKIIFENYFAGMNVSRMIDVYSIKIIKKFKRLFKRKLLEIRERLNQRKMIVDLKNLKNLNTSSSKSMKIYSQNKEEEEGKEENILEDNKNMSFQSSYTNNGLNQNPIDSHIDYNFQNFKKKSRNKILISNLNNFSNNNVMTIMGVDYLISKSTKSILNKNRKNEFIKEISKENEFYNFEIGN